MAEMTPQDRADYGSARARDLLFDAVIDLWRDRLAQGKGSINHLSLRIGRSPRWVKRALSGPEGWTLKTFGQLVEALEGDIEVCILPDKGHLAQVLSDRLYNKTRFLSSINRMTKYREFARLVELGNDTVEYIMGEMMLHQIKTFWFPLLKQITGADPVPAEFRGRVDEMRKRWVAWGVEN